MKKLLILCAAASFALASCSDEGNPPKDGEDQVPQPVENSGPNTEGQRAVEATVNDSTKAAEKKDTAR